MNEDLIVLGAFLALIVLSIGVGAIQSAKRTRTIAQLASELGYHFEADGEQVEEKILKSGFEVFRHQDFRSTRNLLYGLYRDSTMIVVDYSYVARRGKHQKRYWQTLALFAWDRPRLPEFKLRPLGTPGSGIAQVFYPGISFQDCPQFAYRYHLAGRNETAIRQVFSGSAAKFVRLQMPLTVESSGAWLLVHKSMEIVKPNEMRDFIKEAQVLYDLLWMGL